MSIVNYDYYTNDFFGEKITEDKFQKYSVRAEEIIDLYTHQKISLIGFENFDEKTQMNIKKAICYQIEYLFVNGLSTLSSNSVGGSFTVGKVSVHEKSSQSSSSKQQAVQSVSPQAITYLELSGLLYSAVGWC